MIIEKLVRNVTQNSGFTHQASSRPGDVMEYQVTVRSNSTVASTQVSVTDEPELNQTILTNFQKLWASRNYDGTLQNRSTMSFGQLSSGQDIKILYQYAVSSSAASGARVCNTATARSTNTSAVSDSACVTVNGQVSGSNVFLTYSKKAWNDTKNQDATTVPAGREDYITYTLTVQNSGNADQNSFIITDDLSGILPLADMVDAGGGTLAGNTLTYPSLTVPAGGTVNKTFRVRVKFNLASNISYSMRNTYGNTVTVVINTPPAPLVPPKTGGATDAAAALGFGGLITSAGVLLRKKNLIKLIFS